MVLTSASCQLIFIKQHQSLSIVTKPSPVTRKLLSMLRTTLEFLADELNLYIKRKDPDNFGNLDTVIVSNLMKPDGSFAVASDQGDDTFKIILTLVNLEEDRIAESQQYFQKVNDKIQVNNPPLNLNLHVLFSVFTTNYVSGLRLLSYVIGFFQTHSVFDAETHPHLNNKVGTGKPWQRIGRIIADLNPVSFEQQNNLWAALGAKYMPNVIYRIRTVTFTDVEPKMEAPPVTEIVIAES